VPPRSLAEIPVVDGDVSTTEGCVDTVAPSELGSRLGADPEALRDFFAANRVPLDGADICVPYVAVTGGAEGVASLHLVSPIPQGAGGAGPVPDRGIESACEPIRRVIEVPAPLVSPARLGPLLDIPVRVRWQVEMLLPEMLARPGDEGQDTPASIVRLVLERRGVDDPERLQSIEVLDAATRRRLDGAWWVERPAGPGVLFGLNGTDYERLLWNSAVHFDRVSRGVGPAPRVVTRVVGHGKSSTKKVVTRVVKPQGYHLGIDLLADSGTDVHAVSDGTVAFAGTARGFGKLVIIEHGLGYRTYYAHLSAIAKGLHTGDVLLRGDVLGLVGSTGRSTGPHLHFETRLGSDYIDPRDSSHQLEFWILNPAEQAWVALQMLAPAPAVPSSAGLPSVDPSTDAAQADLASGEFLTTHGPHVDQPAEASGVEIGTPPALPVSVSMVVGADGSAATHAALWQGAPAVCRAYAQLLPPERPELPKPAAPRTTVKRRVAKKPVAKKKTV